MHIDKYLTDDGYEINDCTYEDSITFIASGMLGSCGCGNHEDYLKFIRDSLQIVDDLKTLVWEKKLTYEDWATSKLKLFGSDGCEYFVWYFLTDKDFIEHGSCVPGWLTESGIELLEDLNELYKQGLL